MMKIKIEDRKCFELECFSPILLGVIIHICTIHCYFSIPKSEGGSNSISDPISE
jgi:hypothetical protein